MPPLFRRLTHGPMKIKSPIHRLCFTLLVGIVSLPAFSGAQPANLSQWQAEAIKPSSANPYYWDYKGSPTMFWAGRGRTTSSPSRSTLRRTSILWSPLEATIVRNGMSHRDDGNEFPYVRTSGSAPFGTYDLNQFNPVYWDNFDDFLKLCYDREILVQIEIWETWDYHVDHQKQGGWKYQPFNPARNSNYTAAETGMPTSRSSAPTVNPSGHPFFNTVPGLSDSQTEKVLPYQEAFVDKMLSISLKYPNVLYTMNNETGEQDEWGIYWANYVEDAAAAQGKTVYVTDMRRNVNITAPDHQRVFKDPDNYTFLDISQNNKQEDPNLHWDRFMFVRDILEEDPARIRPINNNKLYSNRGSEWGDYLPIERFFRSFLAGRLRSVSTGHTRLTALQTASTSQIPIRRCISAPALGWVFHPTRRRPSKRPGCWPTR